MPIIYYLNTPEPIAVVQHLQRKGGIFSSADFRELNYQRIARLKLGEYAAVMHPDQESIPDYSALIWGTGSDHDISLIMSPQRPFLKSVDDAHLDYVDMVTTALTGVNECTHNGVLLHSYCHAKAVEVLGNNMSHVDVLQCGPNKEPKLFCAHQGPSLYKPETELPIHKSIDLDVLLNFPARHDWQNNAGSGVSLEALRANLEALCRDTDVIRFDIGGLHFPTEQERSLYHGKINPLENREVMNRACETYAVLLETYFSNLG